MMKRRPGKLLGKLHIIYYYTKYMALSKIVTVKLPIFRHRLGHFLWSCPPRQATNKYVVLSWNFKGSLSENN